MTPNKSRRPTIAGISVLIAATFLNANPASAAANQSFQDGTSLIAVPPLLQEQSVNVLFQNLPVALPMPPRLIKGTIMVPGKALLESLGYKTAWHAGEKKLVAEHENKPTLVFWANQAHAELDGKRLAGLPAAPYIEKQTLWIPLRLAAEASGLRIAWDSRNRYAIVSDPQALPKFSIMTKVDNVITDTPVRLFDYMKQALKMDVDFVQVAPEYYRQKSMVMIAAGDPTSLMLLEDPYLFQDELLSSFAIDLTRDLEAFPRLRQLALSGSGSRVIDGKIFGVPRPSDPHNDSFPAIRKDWLNKLGLAQPQTMEELYVTLKQFVANDPDGNNKNDTIGLIGQISENGLGTLSWVEHAFTGSPDRLSVKDGKVVDHAVGNEETLALQWLVRAYAEGLLDKEFAVVSGQQISERLRNNKAGLSSLTINEAADLTGDEATWVPLTAVRAASTSNPIAPWNAQGSGTYIISKTSRVEAKQVLAWLEHGLEKTETGGWKSLDGWDQADQQAVNSLFGQPDMLKDNSGLDSLPTMVRSEYETAVKEWRKISYSSTALPEASGIWQTGKYAELNRELERMKLKVIMGESSIEDWRKLVNDYTVSADYKAMLAELNQLVSKRAK